MIGQNEIPFFFMRGGTSRGPYFNAADLPENRDDIARILLQVIGAGHPLNIDGIGGGNQVTNKVAILSRSNNKETDIDYLFAQVSVADQLVDFKPTCGNILSGVGPAAIEMGLIPASNAVTKVRIKLVNTGALVEAQVQTRVVTFVMKVTQALTVCRGPQRGLIYNSWMLSVQSPGICYQRAI